MISHSIIVHKEPPRIGTVYTSGEKKGDAYISQETYEAWIKIQPFAVGDYVTLLPSHVRLTTLMQANCITQIGTTFSKLEWSTFSKEHKPYRVRNCNIENTVSPWVRWDSMTGYRLLSAEEYDATIKPVHDKLQAHNSKHG